MRGGLRVHRDAWRLQVIDCGTEFFWSFLFKLETGTHPVQTPVVGSERIVGVQEKRISRHVARQHL